ncbi:MAG: serine/threonine protein kinase, partial [bacterium]
MDRVFGNYLFTRRIGAGGMGEVYQAVKRGPEGFEVEVALKLILPHLAGDASFRDMFFREARLAALLKHPNIVNVHGFDILEDIPFIEMEYVQGVDLASLLRRLPRGQVLSLAEAVHVVHCVARGLAYAHSFSGGKGEGVGVVHRDLNPHNILVSREGEVKIADFGIARAAVTAGAASATLMGKLAYMSPEQVEGKPLDHRSDLFSLGTTAYHLLAGRHPFQRQSEAATLRAIQQVSFRPLREAAPDVPLPVARVVESLLALLPGDRPETARLVAEAFQEH